MSSFLDFPIFNTTFFDIVNQYITDISIAIYSTIKTNVVQVSDDSLFSEFIEIVESNLSFDVFQLKLLKVLFGILFMNILFIYFAWNFYKDDIWEYFMRPTSVDEDAELQKRIELLNLPREHTPRI